MHYSLPTNRRGAAGFTLIEVLIIAPIVVLMIGAFVGLMVSMVGDVLTARDQTALTYDAQSALDRIEQDTRLSTQFLTTSGTQTAPQGSNNNFTGTNAFVNASSLILSELATDRNPTDPTRALIYYDNQPNPCGANQRFNRVMLTKVIYFIKSGSLWRRIIAPDYNKTPADTTCANPWQQNSCSPGYATATRCATNDEEILKNFSSLQVNYYSSPDSTTPLSPAESLNASTISATISASKQVAGRTVTSTGSMRATKLNSIDTTLPPPTTPSVSHTFSTPNSVQFSWPTVPLATSYQVSYQINSGSWTNQIVDANTVSYTVTAERNDTVAIKVTAFNGSGGSTAGTDGATMPQWTDLALQNNWVSYSGPTGVYSMPGYTRTSSGRVFLRGLIKGGTAASGTVIATLPEGYQPTGRLVFPAGTSPNTPARVDVDSNGNVILYSGNNTWTSLDNISFMPDSTLLPSNQQYTWHTMPFLNGWSSWGSGYEDVHATLDNVGRVALQGLARAGTTATNTAIVRANTISSGYLPPKSLHFQAGGSGFSDFWVWYDDGEVTKRGTQTSSYMGLNALWYPGSVGGTGGWKTVTAANIKSGWVNYAGNYPTLQYTKGPDDVVTVRGLVKSGTVTGNPLVVNLPAGYRPSPQTSLIVTPSNDDYGRVDVGPDGDITIRAADAAWLALNFSFVADQ